MRDQRIAWLWSSDSVRNSQLELKKKYLAGADLPAAGAAGVGAAKSASVSDLDSKLRSFVDRIDEAQKLLHPAPQPSVPMQVQPFSQLDGDPLFRRNKE